MKLPLIIKVERIEIDVVMLKVGDQRPMFFQEGDTLIIPNVEHTISEV